MKSNSKSLDNVSTNSGNGNTNFGHNNNNNSNRHRPNSNNNAHSNSNNNSNRNRNNNNSNRNRNIAYDDNVLGERNTEQNYIDNNHLNDDGDSSAVIVDPDDENIPIDGVARSKVSRSSSMSSSSSTICVKHLFVAQMILLLISIFK